MSTMNGDTFIDILEERRKTSDIAWASKTWDVPPCRYSLQRTPLEIKKQILNSEKVQNLIKEVSIEHGCAIEEVKEKVNNILDEMSHEFNFKVIRFFGFVLSKFMKCVYGKILVNKKGVEKIASVSTQYPVLFLPTHRSYADFLLVSYICFYFNLPVPVIAAGLDFLGMKALGFLLRGAGAFFIRRSFVGDQLYREIFTQYVQTHIEGCEFPMEFFIEGTRSRTAKSLVPKLGMLQAILELFFSSKVSDIIVVPISICYDRTLEETLYAYELLGVPKPKESTKGLFKARKILSDYFGNVYVRFGEQISLRKFFKGYDRSSHNLHPRSLSVTYKEEQVLCRDLANHVIRMHQCNLLLSPFPLVCLVVSQPKYLKKGGVHITHLVDYIYWLEELVKRTGATIYTGGQSMEVLWEQLQLHSNIMEVMADSVVSLKDTKIEHPTAHIRRLSPSSIRQAIPVMFAYHYGNQALQLLIHICIICLAVTSNAPSQESVFFRYRVLRKLLQKEFVFERLTAEKDFAHALQSLKEDHILTNEDSKIVVFDSQVEKVDFLQSLLFPFLQSYHAICQYLLNKEELNCKVLPHECQVIIEKDIEIGNIHNYQCLSLDIINNCIAFLVCEGALFKDFKQSPSTMYTSHIKLSHILLDLELFMPGISGKSNQHSILSIPSAKL